MNNLKFHRKEKGAALLLFVLLFLTASVALVYILNTSIYQDLVLVRKAVDTKQTYFAAISGNEDYAYRLVENLTPGATEYISIAGRAVETNRYYDSDSEIFELNSVAEGRDATRTTELHLAVGAGASFNFGVQAGNGGFEMTNSSEVRGNVFANGSIRKTGGGTAIVRGDVISASSTGLIDDIHATGSAWANTITDTWVEGDAYFNVDGGGNIIDGTAFSPHPNQDYTELPIKDETIEDWKQHVLDDGVVYSSTSPECAGGTFTLDYSTTTGPVKFECDVDIKETGGTVEIILQGVLWVEGNLSFTQGPELTIDPTIGKRTIAVIADNESNRTTSSKIHIKNSTQFTGSGDPKSYIVLISMNESSELGGLEQAIDLDNSATGDVLVYAAHGLIDIANGIDLKEVTGHKIALGNSAIVEYESGLVNLLFTGGPGGGFVIYRWNEL